MESWPRGAFLAAGRVLAASWPRLGRVLVASWSLLGRFLAASWSLLGRLYQIHLKKKEEKFLEDPAHRRFLYRTDVYKQSDFFYMQCFICL